MRIAMPRGDIKWQRFLIHTPDREVTELDFTNIYFTVKKRPTDNDFLFQKSLKRGEIFKLAAGDYQLKIDPQDTNDLALGNYIFDIQISYKNLLKESFVGDFVLKPEVTYYGNEDGEEESADFTLPTTSEPSTTVLVIPNYHLLELQSPVEVSANIGDYNLLSNKPKINGVELVGDQPLESFGIQADGTYVPIALTISELDEILS